MDDPGSLIFSIVLLFLLILVNAFFAMSEMAIVSLNDNMIDKLAEEGHKKAKKIKKLTENPSNFLSTIQIGVTLAGFLTSASASTTFAEMLTNAVLSINPSLEKFDDVKSLRPDEFADYIIEKFGCECTFCGENFRFGKNAEGNSQVLSQLMTEHGKNSVTVASKLADGMVVSSTRILGLLRDGKVSEAHELLGKPFGFTSEVIHGAHLGNKLGFPTVNQIIPAELVYPKYGVYSTIAVIDGKEYMGVTNFGIKPTVSDDGTPVAETYIIDFDGDVYGKSLSLYFVTRDVCF